ncbi:MAG TPA: hypothetical protein PKH77_28650 [Anaerolineae bacterium]|nr:hypothetical protein [Anaerolineae bacterium]
MFNPGDFFMGAMFLVFAFYFGFNPEKRVNESAKRLEKWFPYYSFNDSEKQVWKFYFSLGAILSTLIGAHLLFKAFHMPGPF